MARTHPVISIEHLEPVVPDPFQRTAVLPPGPLRADTEDGTPVDKYIIEKILSKRRHKHSVEYQVKWFGYDEISWEPATNLIQDVPLLIHAFEQQGR
jgi:hypothetical protein